MVINTFSDFVLVYKAQNNAGRNEDGNCVMGAFVILKFFAILEGDYLPHVFNGLSISLSLFVNTVFIS